MPLLTGTNIAQTFGMRIILEDVSISIEPGERIGIVGRNGTGKSTLLKALGGVQSPDSGMVVLQRGSRAGYLHQDPLLDPNETLKSAAEQAFERLHALHHRQQVLYEELADLPPGSERYQSILREQTAIEGEIEALGGYAIDHKIEAVLHGLGFVDAQFTLPVRALSGGQRGRLALAKLLLEAPDVLLLDEPTNHLDIEGRLWLESFLKDEFRGAVVLISHDRYLLDNVVTRIVEVEQARLIDYPGNYEKFRELRAERRMAMLRAFENEQTRFKKEEAFIRKYRAGQRAKQAQGRLAKLTRAKSESTLERPMEMDTFAFKLPKAERTGDVVLTARGVSKTYLAEDGTEKVLFRNLDVQIARGERWGIIGPNGAGKSTLVRILMKELEPDAGTVKHGSNLKVGYYRQTHEHVDLELPVYRYLQNVILKENPGLLLSEQQARDLAGAFLFSGDEQIRPLRELSGGERSRAVLAGLLASAKNVIVLDEPTNHLDIPSAERLEDALSLDEGFDGTMILISHDRALIDATCDHLIVLDGKGGTEIFLGGYTEWHEKDVARRAEAEREAAEAQRRREDAEKRRRQGEEDKKRSASKPRAPGDPQNKYAKLSLEQLEQRIEKFQTRIKEIDEAMLDPDVWRNAKKSNQLGEERAKLVADLEPLEFEWSRRAEEG
ncbi:MAG: ABC-F family ATP-binding cassette domain-containing protein [Planctomycetota bacterium]|nr:ABC-F family ATP-binding cassette domain-containing protein [Planctomycetota bacterium]